MADADLLREIERLGTQARFNRIGANVARETLRGVRRSDLDVDEVHTRAEANDREASRLESRVEVLVEEAERRDLRCAQTGECACARCEEDGPATTYLGDWTQILMVGRRECAEVYLSWTERPRRGPIECRFDRTGKLVPKDRGERRAEALRILQGFVDNVASTAATGRPRGQGMDREEVRAAVDEFRSAGMTVDDACDAVSASQHWGSASIRSLYYDRRPDRQ